MADLMSDAQFGIGAQPKVMSDAEFGMKPTGRDVAANFALPIAALPADILGLPGDTARWIQNHAVKGINAVAGTHIPEIAPDAFGTSASISRGMTNAYHAVGLDALDPVAALDKPADNNAEAVARAAGSGAAAALSMGAGAEAALARTWAEGESLGNAALEMVRGSGPVSNTLIGAGSGAGSELAREAAPDKYKNLAGFVGGMGAGGLVGAAGAAGAATVDAGRGAWQSLFEPAEVRAARMILDKATDPDAVKQALETGASGVVNKGEEGEANLAGSMPTTFQATGDLGVGALERGVASSPTGIAPFAARREQQNAARLDALDSLYDPTAKPEAVTDFVKDQLKDITVNHAAQVSDAANTLADRFSTAGGENFDNNAAYGDALRAPLDALHQDAKAQTNALWRAIDPDMSAPVSTAPLKQATADLMGSIASTAKPPSGEESSILSVIGDLGQDTSFGEMAALRGRLTDAIRNERKSADGSPTVLRRLAITLDNVDSTLAAKAGEIAADPQAKTAMLDRLGQDLEDVDGVNQVGARQASGSDTGVLDGSATDDSSAARTSGSALGGNSNPAGSVGGLAGDTSLQTTSGIPEDVAGRYAAARQATADQKGTFSSGPVGSALRPGPRYGTFAMTSSSVPKTLFDRPEDLMKFVKTAGDNPEAMAQMQDYAAFSLRQAAVRDGQLNPAAYQKWIDSHGYALRTFPDVATNFAGVATAQDSLDASLAAQKTALTDYQTSAARHFLNDQDPVVAVGKAIRDPKQFAQLAQSMQGVPPALAGLRRATVEYMLGKTLSNAEAGTSGLNQIKADALQNFIADNRVALSTIFSADERASMNAVAGDLQRANRSIVAARMPGTSGTTVDTAMIPKNGTSVIQNLLWQAAGALAGSAAGHPVLGFMAGAVTPALRAARMDNVNRALTEMMLDPRKAAAGMAKIPADSASSAADTFAARMRALTANEMVTESARTGKQDQ